MGDDRPVVRVAVPVPLADVFDYLAPSGASPTPGTRVRVPFGRGERVGIVVEHSAVSALAPAKLKPIREVLDGSAPLGAELMHSLRWAADYYHHPIGEVLTHALPAVLREGARSTSRRSERGASPRRDVLSRWPRSSGALSGKPRRSPRSGSVTRARPISRLSTIKRDVIERLADRGWIEPCEPRPRAARRCRLAGDRGRHPRRSTAGDRRARAHARSARGRNHDSRGARGRLSRLSAARRDRQRQDRGVPALDRGRARGEPADAAARARDRG